MLRFRTVFPILTLLAVQSFGVSARGENPSPWLKELDQALLEAGRLNKPMMVDVYSAWCNFCKKMRSEVYPSSSVSQESVRYILVSVNGEKNPQLMQKYSIRGFPSVLFLDKNGYLLERIDGYIGAPRLSRIMRDVFRKSDVEEKLRESVRREPDDVQANYRIAHYYSSLERYGEARRYFLRAWKSAKKGFADLKRDALYNAAVTSMELKEYDRAVSFWNTYLKLAIPDDHDYLYARFYRGLSLQKLGSTQAARTDLELAAQNLPSEKDRRRARRALNSLSDL